MNEAEICRKVREILLSDIPLEVQNSEIYYLYDNFVENNKGEYAKLKAYDKEYPYAIVSIMTRNCLDFKKAPFVANLLNNDEILSKITSIIGYPIEEDNEDNPWFFGEKYSKRPTSGYFSDLETDTEDYRKSYKRDFQENWQDCYELVINLYEAKKVLNGRKSYELITELKKIIDPIYEKIKEYKKEMSLIMNQMDSVKKRINEWKQEIEIRDKKIFKNNKWMYMFADSTDIEIVKKCSTPKQVLDTLTDGYLELNEDKEKYYKKIMELSNNVPYTERNTLDMIESCVENTTKILSEHGWSENKISDYVLDFDTEKIKDTLFFYFHFTFWEILHYYECVHIEESLVKN